jgi:hypothetical protein
MRQYRIVRDAYLGYEVQCRQWWWPFWVQCGFVNTHANIEAARKFAFNHATGGVVEYLNIDAPKAKGEAS